ncbi:transketolase C-terminal domain-containing protein, partial [Pantoea sp. CTOTU49201]|uniref:transketolase family protein n=1 Tax=Pantoea sp. CTOTU49201 TaxID=2953855 RepID=UPI00289EAE00
FPDRLSNVGIAEQTLVGTAAGLAIGGKVAVTCNAAPFLVSRANEQVKVDVCYNNTNVKLFGLNAGASYGPLASTHHSIDDIAVMRGFGNIEIYAPSCPLECRQIIEYALAHVGPVYIRLDGKDLPQLHDENYQFRPGQIDVLREGHDILLVAMGSTVHEVVHAAEQLHEQGITAGVISIPSIRPCDTQQLRELLNHYPAVITVEEHNVNGGVGSLVAEVLAEGGCGIPLLRLGIPDGEYAIAGDRASTRARHGIDAASVVKSAARICAGA